MRVRTIAVAALLAAVAPSMVAAQGIVASGRVGTLGLGADVSFGVLPRLALRVGASFQPWEPSREIDDIDFELQLPSPNFMGAVDLYLAGPLRLSAGIISFGSDIEVTGDLTQPVEIGDETYSPQEIGTLTGVFDTKNVAPWAGIGLGKSLGPGVGFTMDLGVAFSGEPEVMLNATGPLSSQPAFQANLAQEEANLQEDASLVKLFPVVSIGLSIGFR
jgi:hypothetical protein